MTRSASAHHNEIRLRGVRGWTPGRGSEPPHVPLTPSEKAELARLAQVIDFRTAGSEIFSQGDEADYLYLLTDGVVRTCHLLPNGERQILAFHWPGDLFGLAEAGRYTSEASTIAASRVYRFSVPKLHRFLMKNPKVQDGMLVKTVHDLRQAQRQIIIMGRLDVPRRLAAFLIDCSAHDHYFNRESKRLSLPMSRDDIADYLGTSGETITRALGRLERGGMLQRVSARDIRMDRDQLQAFIGLV